MTPTPTPALAHTRRLVSPTRVKLRKRALARAGVTYHQLAAEAKVSWSMTYKWVAGYRTSSVIEAAFNKLTSKGPGDHGE